MKKSSLIQLLLLPLLLFSGCSNKNKNNDEEYFPPKPVYDARFSRSLGDKKAIGQIKLSVPDSIQDFDTSSPLSLKIVSGNISSGLVGASEFGRPEFILASSATRNSNFTSFSFTLKDDKNLVWVDHTGEPYIKDGKRLKIKASDFKYGYMRYIQVCIEYYVNPFKQFDPLVRRSLEYSCYFQVMKNQSKYGVFNNQVIANEINRMIEENYPTYFVLEGYDKNPISSSDIPDIANGSRLGIIYDNDDGTITYNLVKECSYFPSLLQEAPYLPSAEDFYKDLSRYSRVTKDSHLYCGPFYVSDITADYPYSIAPCASAFVLRKNKYYDYIEGISPANKAYIDKVTIIGTMHAQEAYEKGEIDGFYTGIEDASGTADKYVYGPDGTGSIENPYNKETSVFFDDRFNGYYGSFLNVGLHNHNSGHSSEYDENNTLRALRINAVRELLIKAFDYTPFYTGQYHKYIRYYEEETVHTYTPRNICYESYGNEYVDTYLAQVYSEKMNISLEEARNYLSVGQYETHQYSDEQVAELVDKAINAIELYNANEAFVSEYGKIELPISFEFSLNTYFYSKYNWYVGNDVANSMNARMNKLSSFSGDFEECNLFRIYNLSKSAYESSRDTSNHDFGIAVRRLNVNVTYPDPYLYLGAFDNKNNNNWGSYYSYLGEDSMTDFKVIDNEIVKVDSLSHLRELIRDADATNDYVENRFLKMALAEYELLEETHIYKPGIAWGQGYTIAVSKMTSVGLPKQMYSKINEGRLTGLWALEIPLTNEETQEMIEEEAEYKEEYDREHSDSIYGD